MLGGYRVALTKLTRLDNVPVEGNQFTNEFFEIYINTKNLKSESYYEKYELVLFLFKNTSYLFNNNFVLSVLSILFKQ